MCRVSNSAPFADLGLASTASFGAPPKSADSHVTLVLNYTYPSSSDEGCSKIYTSIEFVCNRTAPLDVSKINYLHDVTYIYIYIYIYILRDSKVVVVYM